MSGPKESGYGSIEREKDPIHASITFNVDSDDEDGPLIPANNPYLDEIRLQFGVINGPALMNFQFATGRRK